MTEAKLIEGEKIAAGIREKIALEVTALKKKTGKQPCLAVVLVGENPASVVYVNKKHAACEKAGIKSLKIELPSSVSEKKLLEEIKKLNENKGVHGILVQMPLPPQINMQKVLLAVDENKDVDGFNPINFGRLFAGEPLFTPATPTGIMALLDAYGVELEGKHVVVVGRSNIVGKPVAALLLARNATVTQCHSRTRNLKELTRQADVLVVAVGKTGFASGDFVKQGAVVIDVGVNRLANGKLAGDVDFESVRKKASLITPVPGGVGPMTIACLLQNTVKAFKLIEGVRT